MTTHKGPRIIDLPKTLDRRGNLSIIEELKNIPFKIKRTYWIYDVPGGEVRGGHAYKENQEFIVALSGSFDVIIDDGKERKTFSLKGAELKNISVYIRDLSGQTLVKTKTVSGNKIDISALKSGAYMLTAQQGNNVVSWKLIKE